ncbi:MAG TPA: rod shape-determining protein MreD [Candidatus Blautia merdigallinarum]|uniref:Rod shape-determining protein MreD n=1 Tax=Candidatus Blautia merdigallinarum TaxID=2838495 RepID=A0A9D2N694_9FIRM|nr:rod shape-determining protein MreD [Candidatus Blautia merdigallinarum]
MRVKRKLFYILTVLICFILQTTVFQGLAIGSIVPNLLLIATISFGFMRGKTTGLWVGFFCGILKDIFYGNLLGFYALIYLCIGYGAGCCTKIFYDEEIRVPMFLVAAGDLLYGMAVYGFQFLLRGRTDLFFYIRRIIIPEMIYTVLITVVLYKLLFIINKKLTELEMKERDSFWLRK